MLILGVEKSRLKPKRGPYSQTIKLNDRFRDSCENKQLVSKGAFTVKKFKVPTEDQMEGSEDEEKWVFQACLSTGSLCNKVEGILSRLVGELDGECNDVKTFDGSEHCGLATALMEFCFTDPDIGTVNLHTNYHW